MHSEQDAVDTIDGGHGDVDSELTDLAELDEEFKGTPKARPSRRTGLYGAVSSGDNIAMPSPRRLRSKSKDVSRAPISAARIRDTCIDGDAEEVDKDRRVTPMRKAKGKIRSLREDSESIEGDEESADDEDAEEDGRPGPRADAVEVALDRLEGLPCRYMLPPAPAGRGRGW